jgi:hypothetical protein
MPESQDLVYLLSNNLDRFRHTSSGETSDVEPFSFDNIAQIWQVHQNKKLDLPNPTFFYQRKAHNLFYELDSLNTFLGCTIFSQRLIDALLSIKDFQYRKYPIAVLKEKNNIDPYKDIEKSKKLSLRNDLFIFQTLEFIDVFDWEKSEYIQEDFDKDMNIPTHVNKFALKEPDKGFPPLFRLPFKQSSLFISGEARKVLKELNIKGPSFRSLLSPGRNSITDVSID